MKYVRTDRSNLNDKRGAVETTLQQAGLVTIAGGTRFSYYGLPGQGVDGFSVRVGIRTYRLVKRIRLSGAGIKDISYGKEHYHGQADLEKLSAYAKKMIVTKWGTIASAPPAAPEVGGGDGTGA